MQKNNSFKDYFKGKKKRKYIKKKVCNKFHCGVLLGHFNLDLYIMVSKAVAADASDALARQTDLLVGLDSCRDLIGTTS